VSLKQYPVDFDLGPNSIPLMFSLSVDNPFILAIIHGTGEQNLFFVCAF